MAATGGSRKPGPPSTLPEIREQLVAAATERLYETGVEVGLGSVRLSEAIEIVGVPRATAYRSLADEELDPQDRLRRDVLRRVLARDTRGTNFDMVSQAVGAELEAQVDNLSSDDVADRTHSFRAIMRRGCTASFHGVGDASERAILMAAMSAIASQNGPVASWQLEALIDGERAAATQFDQMYSAFAEMFGYQLRAGYTIEQFATASAALLEGLCLRYGISDELDDIPRPTGIDGAAEPWTLYGICFEGVFLMFYEPRDLDDPFADLANY